jgi:hypothetical protein
MTFAADMIFYPRGREYANTALIPEAQLYVEICAGTKRDEGGKKRKLGASSCVG